MASLGLSVRVSQSKNTEKGSVGKNVEAQQNQSNASLGPRYGNTASKRPALYILMEPITHRQACWLLYELNVLIHGFQKHESSVHIILVYG